jgi:predicted Zn-dependent protease
MPITVRLLDSEQVEAFTLPGGYQYITRELLLQLENEGELASVLARGIAHTALRSATRLMTRQAWANVGTIPMVYVGSSVPPNSTSGAAIPLTMLSLRRRYEFDADYFGVQYAYKAGYNTESFSHFVQRMWPTSRASVRAFSPFPPTLDRLNALHKEITDLLPKRDGEIVSTPEFEKFKERLRNWRPTGPVPTQTGEMPMPHE